MYRRTGSCNFEMQSDNSDNRSLPEAAQPISSKFDGENTTESDQCDAVINVTQLNNGSSGAGEKQLEMNYDNPAFVFHDEECHKGEVRSRDGQPSDEKSARSSSFFEDPRDMMSSAEKFINRWLNSHKRKIKDCMKLLLLVTYNVYLGFAMYLSWDDSPSWCQGVKLLVIITAIAYTSALYQIVLKPYVLPHLLRIAAPSVGKISKLKHCDKFVWLFIWIAVTVFLVLDSRDNRYRLVSAGGLVILIFLGFIFSAHPRQVIWKQVQWGIITQFIFGLLILRWNVGREMFECLGKKIETFLQFADNGSSFVFGYLVTGELNGTPVQDGVFAFKVLCVVIFFSFVVSILYYYGVMQVLVINVGWLLQNTIGTTACESMNAAGNIFLGMTESPLLIKPYLPVMTKSELHAVLTGGFATIAGSVMAAYINFGVKASHLLSASVMSAPAALAYSKLLYPETEKSVTKADDIKIEKPKERNALEAGTNGASTAISLVANIAANLVAFVAFIALLDGLFTWFGSLVHWEFLSFEWFLSKLLIPISLLMGVEWKDKDYVSTLIGLKTFVNEFVAYRRLAEFQSRNLLSPRSEAIATFALCGFSNFGSIGIQIGALGTMAPDRKADLASLSLRAMIAGSAACFMTACVAGALMNDIG